MNVRDIVGWSDHEQFDLCAIAPREHVIALLLLFRLSHLLGTTQGLSALGNIRAI